MEIRLITLAVLGISMVIVWMLIDRKLGKKVEDFAVVYILMFFINFFFWLMDSIERKIKSIRAASRIRKQMQKDFNELHLRVSGVSTLDDYEESSAEITAFEIKYTGVKGRNKLSKQLTTRLSEKSEESLYLAY